MYYTWGGGCVIAQLKILKRTLQRYTKGVGQKIPFYTEKISLKLRNQYWVCLLSFFSMKVFRKA
jgi:hypothetical protein